MKRIFVFLYIVLIFSSALSAQNLTMSLKGKVKCEETDLDATLSVKGKTDSNNQLCALLKVTLTNQLNNPLVLNVGSFAAVVAREEQEDGKIWFWVPAGVKNLSFSCKGYKDMDPIPVELKNGKVYTLTIDTGAEYTMVTNASLRTNYLKMNIEPENAIVSLGKTKEYEIITQVVDDGGFVSDKLDYGTYYYKVENDFYKTNEGSINIGRNDTTLTIKLVPAFNYLKITSTPDGASVLVNGKNIGQTPAEVTERIKKGKCEIKLILEEYYNLETVIDLPGDGGTVFKNFELKPRFGNVVCTSDDPDAEIWIDDELKGKGSWSGRLTSVRKHKLEVKKDHHQSQSKLFTVNEGETKTETIGAPVPLTGTIDIITDPKMSDVYIDGKSYGKSPIIKQLLIGEHKVKISKKGYKAEERVVELLHNETFELNVKMEKEKSGLKAEKRQTAGQTGAAKPVSQKKVGTQTHVSVSQTPETQKQKEKVVAKSPSRIIWLMRFGPNMDIGIPSHDDLWIGTGAEVGYNFSLGFMGLSKRGSFYGGLDLGVTSVFNCNSPSVELSPSIGWRIGKGNVRFDPHIGVIAGLETHGMRFIYGASAGMGLWFGRFNIDINYQQLMGTITEWYNLDELTFMPGMLQFRIGFSFGRKN